MPLTDLQKASFRFHLHSSVQIIDPDTGEPIGEGGFLPTEGPDGDVLTVVSGAWASAAPSGSGSGVGDKLYLAANYR